jgi:chromosome segregation ATPase
MSTNDSLPDDVETLKQLVLARDAELVQARAEAASARAEASSAQAEASSTEALVMHLRLTIEKLKRDLFGARNERKARLVDQMELQLEELEAAATEDEIAAEKAAAPRRSTPSPAESPLASRSRRICRASVWSCPARPSVPAAARSGSPSSVRT